MKGEFTLNVLYDLEKTDVNLPSLIIFTTS